MTDLELMMAAALKLAYLWWPLLLYIGAATLYELVQKRPHRG